MRTRFVKFYLYFVAVTLSVTFVGKLGAVVRTVFHLPSMYQCIEDPMFGPSQPIGNDPLLAIAAGIEFVIVMLICFCRARWVPCLASALWGTICVGARVYFTVAGTDCGCLGWLAEPGPTTNLIVGLLALAIAAGGYTALGILWRDFKPFKRSQNAAVT
ncbi:MAG TPA: hypothetical protein VMF08_04035 [Candidatus Sulfotelmatobacter sp.]|nr:hypothetical protein [Candidatus Sulfotelmatobacter sp.]